MGNKLIVNADDFGYTPGITQGILAAHQRGIVSSTTALVVSEYFEEAMEVARKTPSLNVGLHLTLTLKATKPLLGSEVSSLINEKGEFWSQSEFQEHIKSEEVYAEWDAQIAKFLSSGHQPSHLDSHHNVHGKDDRVLAVALELAKKYKLPLRKASRAPETKHFDDLYGEVAATDKLIATFYDENATKEHLLLILKEIGAADSDHTYEINCHPAYIDPMLTHSTSYLTQRLREWEILTDPEIIQAVQKNHIQLINYSYIR